MNQLYGRLPIFAQNLACGWAGRIRAHQRFTPYFRDTLAEWEDSRQGPSEALREIQRTRLHRLVERCRRHVPQHRNLPPTSEARDPREAISRTLKGIPPLDKADYAARPRDFVARDIPRRRLRSGQTSGTTGTALPLWYTPETLAEEYATVWRLRRACGVELDDPHLSFGGQISVPVGQTRPPFWRTNGYGRQILFSLYHMSPENLPAYVEAIHSSPARYAQGYPSSLHLIGRAMLEMGRPLPPGRLAAVFTSSESLLAFQRETIEAAFGAPVRDRYGTSEFAVSMTECPEGRLHVDMEFCIVEVEPVEETDEWVRGPLLVTGLGNDATGFLRYRIGDVGTQRKRPCPCGRPGDAFENVDGRIEDSVVTPDGRSIGRLDHIFKAQVDVAEAQILQETREAIEVRVVPRASWSEASARSLNKEIRSRLGEELSVELRLVESIAREPNGKFRAVKSRVGRNRA